MDRSLEIKACKMLKKSETASTAIEIKALQYIQLSPSIIISTEGKEDH